MHHCLHPSKLLPILDSQARHGPGCTLADLPSDRPGYSAQQQVCMGVAWVSTWSTLFMKQVLPKLDRPRRPYGELCVLLMALALASADAEAVPPAPY